MKTSREIQLLIADMHDAADHDLGKDHSKFLKAEQRKFIADAVKIAPMQTASELTRNVQNSLSKAIDPGLKNSVHRLIVDERKKLNAVVLEGIEVTDQLGPQAADGPNLVFSCQKGTHRWHPEQTAGMHSAT